MLVKLETDRLVTIEEVATRFGISRNHLMKVAFQLGQGRYLERISGLHRQNELEGSLWSTLFLDTFGNPSVIQSRACRLQISEASTMESSR